VINPNQDLALERQQDDSRLSAFSGAAERDTVVKEPIQYQPDHPVVYVA
jgi:hypothetical protein